MSTEKELAKLSQLLPLMAGKIHYAKTGYSPQRHKGHEEQILKNLPSLIFAFLCVFVVKVNSLTEQQSAQTLAFNPEPVLKFECSIDQVWARTGFVGPRGDDQQVFSGVFCPDKFLNPGLISGGLKVKRGEGIGEGFSDAIHLNAIAE